MRRTTRHATIAVLVVTAVLGLLAVGGAGAQESPTAPEPNATSDESDPTDGTATTDGNATSENASGESVDAGQLRSGGQTVSGGDPSMRWLPDAGSVYVDYPGSNPLTNTQTEDWQAQNVLENNALVETNELTVNSQRPRDAESESYELEVVYWSETTTQTDNGTVSETQVESRETKELTFEGPFDRQTVELQQSDSERRVTMWLEDSTGDRIDGAQWTFRHHSIPTSQGAGIDTMGDYLGTAIMEFLAPIGLGVFAVGAIASKAVKRAGKGPGYGYGPWIFVLSLACIVGALFAFSSLAELLVGVPLLAALFISGLVGIVVLESDHASTKKTLFLRPHLVDVANPRGDDVVDSMLGDAREETLVELQGGQQAVVRSGLLPFLSRVFGGMAKLTPTRPMTTEMNLVDSEWDQLVFVDPDADETLDYQPEGWQLEFPALEERGDYLRVGTLGLVLVGIVGSVGTSVSWTLGFVVGAVAIVGYLATPRSTSATVEPASGHERAALTSMMYLAEAHDDAETIESAREKLIQERAQSERDIDDALEKQDATLIEEMFGSDVDRRIVDEPTSTSSDDPADELAEGSADD